MARRLKADCDQRQLVLFGEGMALGMRPKVTKALPIVSATPQNLAPKPLPTLPAFEKQEPRKALNALPVEVVRPAEAAALLSISPSLLKKWRMRGDGPRFVKLGGRAIGYRRVDLSEWLEARVT